MGIKVVANNRKASHDFFLLDKYEAGLVLTGSEIKSVRAGRISLAEAFVTIEQGEAWLMDAHIAPYNEASSFNHEPRRPRKLLLHRKEIAELDDEISKKGMTVVPLKVYLKDGLAKVEIAIAKGKKLYDKRQAIAKRDAEREMERHLHERK